MATIERRPHANTPRAFARVRRRERCETIPRKLCAARFACGVSVRCVGKPSARARQWRSRALYDGARHNPPRTRGRTRRTRRTKHERATS